MLVQEKKKEKGIMDTKSLLSSPCLREEGEEKNVRLTEGGGGRGDIRLPEKSLSGNKRGNSTIWSTPFHY